MSMASVYDWFSARPELKESLSNSPCTRVAVCSRASVMSMASVYDWFSAAAHSFEGGADFAGVPRLGAHSQAASERVVVSNPPESAPLENYQRVGTTPEPTLLEKSPAGTCGRAS